MVIHVLTFCVYCLVPMLTGVCCTLQVHYILNELCMGGMVLETNMTEILTRIDEQNKVEKQEVGAGVLAYSSAGILAYSSTAFNWQLNKIIIKF